MIISSKRNLPGKVLQHRNFYQKEYNFLIQLYFNLKLLESLESFLRASWLSSQNRESESELAFLTNNLQCNLFFSKWLLAPR